MTRTLIYQNASEWLLLQGFVTFLPKESDLIYFFIDAFHISKTWTWTLDPDPKKPEPWKTWTLKAWILKNME